MGPFGGGMSTGQFLGYELIMGLMREQQRQAYLKNQLQIQQQLGTDQARIAQLQQELAAQDKKVAEVQAKAPPMESIDQNTLKQLTQKLEEQQKEIEQLKAENGGNKGPFR